MSHSAEKPYTLPLPKLFPIFKHIFIHSLGSIPHPIRIQHDPSRQPRVYSHTTTPGGGGPFSALGSSRLALAYVKTCGSSTPPPDLLTTLLLRYFHLISYMSRCPFLKIKKSGHFDEKHIDQELFDYQFFLSIVPYF